MKLKDMSHTLATVGKKLFRRGLDATGLPCVYAGVTLMGVFYIFRLTDHNLLLLLPVLLILAGIIGFVHQQKAKSRY